jgi:predicted membrane protein
MLGVLLILIGGVLLGINLGYIPESFKQVLLSWQMIIVLLGLISLLARSIFWGLFLVFAGGLLLVPKLAMVFPGVFMDNFSKIYLPLLVSVTGLLILIAILIRRKRSNSWEKHWEQHTTRQTIESDFSKTNTFGKGEYIVLEPEFRGGIVKTTFGATELDLRKTSLPEGDTYLDITAVFSGIILFIPDEWKVISQVETAFGGIDDKRQVQDVDSSRRLILVGSCVFSGCEIKN